MAKSLCIACAELLPDAGAGECPHCGLTYSVDPRPGGVLRALPGQRKPLTGEDLAKWKRQEAASAAMHVAEANFLPLGLGESWEGIRWVGGSSASGEEIYRVELMHGSREKSPWASVSTRVARHDEPRPSLHQHLENLLWTVWNAERKGLGYLQAAMRDQSPLDGWQQTSAKVNSTFMKAHHVSMGLIDVTVVETRDLLISVESAGVALNDLVLVEADLRRYKDVWD